MAISRPLLFVLIGAVVLFAAVTAVRVLGGGEAKQAAETRPDPSGASMAVAPSASKPSQTSKPPEDGSRGPAPAKQARKHAKGADPQSRALRAIADHKVVVLFFGQYRGADDRATRRAVRHVARKTRGVEVLAASINDVPKYPRVVAGLGVQQSPSTMLIDRTGQARLVEGFLDEGSLLQLVADAR